jgi:hypothetical protein
MKAIVFRFVVAMVGMVALLTVGGSPAAAQAPAATPPAHLERAAVPPAHSEPAAVPPRHSETVCDLHASKQPSYVDCALWFDRGHLRRGAQGDVVGRDGLVPVPLRSMVTGDSAQFYAFRYEQDRWIALPFVSGGMIALATSLVLERRRCKTVGCSNAGSYHAAKIWFITGMSLDFISVPFTSASRRAGNRATWWHNALLSTLRR